MRAGSWIRQNGALLAIQLATVAGLLLLWAGLTGQFRENQNFDYTCCYEPVARRVLEGVGLRQPDGAPAAHYPPGFALLLAGVFAAAEITHIPEDAAIKIFIIGCTLFCVTLVCHIASLMFGRKTGIVAALLWATYPFFLWLGKQPNSETPFMVFFLGAVYAFARLCLAKRAAWGWAALTGILIGLASLVRPMTVIYALVCCAGVWLIAKQLPITTRLALGLCIIAGNVLAILPWELWVYLDDGERIVLGRSSAVSLVEGFNFALGPQDSGVPLKISPAVRSIMEKADADHSRIQTLGGTLGFLASEARDRPGAVAEFLIFKARRAWFGTKAQWLENWTAYIQIFYLILAACGLFVLWRFGNATQRMFGVFILLSTIYFWGMAVLVVPLLRYMIPAMSLLIPLIAVLTVKVLNLRSARGIL